MKTRWTKLMCLVLAAAMLLAVFAAQPTAQASGRAATRYPILLVHGAGFRDYTFGLVNYWGRIPETLEAHGAQVFFGGQDAWGNLEDNAAQLQRRVHEIREETGAGRVNIIAHSRGGIEARYMISSLGMAPYVASLTTISTPHHGSRTMDVFINRSPAFRRVVAVPVDAWFRIVGDTSPDFFRSSEQLSTGFMAQFNRDNPDAPGVYYQSYAAQMGSVWSDIFLAPSFAVVLWFDGPNDGVVSVESAQWGNFRGVLRGTGLRGISHPDTADIRRSSFARSWAEPRRDDGIDDIREFYLTMAQELREMGF